MFSYLNSNGLPTSTELTDSVCRLYHWNTSNYLNVYVVKNLIVNGGAAGGYGFFPINHGNYLDGVFLYYDYMNSSDTTFYYPALFPHEAGHYLGLYHTFEGGCQNNDCTNNNDNVCDTPPDNNASLVCQVINSCVTDEDDSSNNNPFRSTSLGGIGDQMDDHTNYLDYSDCPSHFTEGQKNRMIATLLSARNSLLNSDVCGLPSNSLADNDSQSEMPDVYPNPFSDQLTIPFGAFKTCEFTLYDLTGSVVNGQIVLQESPVIQLADLSDGVYFYELNFDNNHRIEVGKLYKK